MSSRRASKRISVEQKEETKDRKKQKMEEKEAEELVEMSTQRASKRRRTVQKEEAKDRIKQQVEEVNGSFKKSAVVVFAHGAGAPSTSDWMIRWKEMLTKALNAAEVVTFDYPYMSGGKRRAPPKAEKLVDFHSNIVKEVAAKYPGHPLILVGKSMGSRVSCMVAVNGIGVSAIVCLGYPLKGAKGATRDELLLQIDAPIMFVQGSKDGLCSLEKLEAVRKKMKCANELYVVDGGDHSFKIGKKHLQLAQSTQEEAEKLAVHAIATFVSNHAKEG
ncbi:uncharacterized protein LOC132634805 [Lycium barbarum]|uniref:uncharacterized protein LOC132634805 n=1 Tax=Lycium barbarum TaxID=112863 RepID=UPI00293E7105|nr:uncharacterized protein LOC132634805 [Lycium barbarum]